MKIHYWLFLGLFAALISCGDNTETSENGAKQRKDGIISNEPDYSHIINESLNDYPQTLRSDKDIELYDRMVLEIELKGDGSFTIEGKKSDWEDLKEQMDMFYNMNRKLTNEQTAAALKNDGFAGINYPFFNQFTRESYQSFIDQLSKMAETDMKAGLYLQRHSRRIKAFEAVPDERLAFINPLCVIRYVCPDDLPDEHLAKFEEELAKNLYEMRNDLAQEKFGKHYDLIRNKAAADGEARRQLLYLQEMYPAYLMRAKTSELETPEEIEMPKMPPPPKEVIVTEENREE